jgi:hypothetical protein
MLGCELVQGALAQYIADGEPALVIYAPLRAHVRACARCQADAERLRTVEVALHAYPLAMPPVDLAPSIVREVTNANRVGVEEWQLFSWEVWVPIVAFAVALLIAMISMPSHLFTSMTLQDLEASIRAWSDTAGGWFAPLEQLTRNDLFWVLWSSVFVTTAGLGFSLSLKHWNREANRRLREMQDHVAEAASRLLPWERRAH